jgi:peroxiredoxin
MLRWRYLPWLLLGGVGALVLVLQVAGKAAIEPGPVEKPAVSEDHLRDTHLVTRRQLADSNSMLSRVVDGLEAVGHDGRLRTWADLHRGKPVVMLFIKDGCPCTGEIAPFFGRVANLYRDHVRFVGVIDASVKAARRYWSQQHAPELILADPEGRIIRRLEARHGGYVVLLTPAGRIDGFWPGCTAATMRELGRRITHLTGVEERPLDPTGMPEALTTGCPFTF